MTQVIRELRRESEREKEIDSLAFSEAEEKSISLGIIT